MVISKNSICFDVNSTLIIGGSDFDVCPPAIHDCFKRKPLPSSMHANFPCLACWWQPQQNEIIVDVFRMRALHCKNYVSSDRWKFESMRIVFHYIFQHPLVWRISHLKRIEMPGGRRWTRRIESAPTTCQKWAWQTPQQWQNPQCVFCWLWPRSSWKEMGMPQRVLPAQPQG